MRLRSSSMRGRRNQESISKRTQLCRKLLRYRNGDSKAATVFWKMEPLMSLARLFQWNCKRNKRNKTQIRNRYKENEEGSPF